MPTASSTRKPRSYGGQTPDERVADRRERLLAAGLTLFGTQGCHKTAIDQICMEARVTTRHFYELYRDRDHFFRAVYDAVVAETTGAILRGLGEAESPAARIEHGVRAYVTCMAGDPRRARVQCLESLAMGPEFLAYRREVIHRFAALITAEADALAPGLAENEVRLAAIALTAAADALVVEHLLDPEGTRQAELVRALTFVFEAVAGDAGRGR